MASRFIVPLVAAASILLVACTPRSESGERTAVEWAEFGEGTQADIDRLAADGECNGLTMTRNLIIQAGSGQDATDVVAVVAYIDEAMSEADCPPLPTE
ncbi:hypothetical protein ACFUTX_12530 [Microbacterium sp. NPDC057407]|uniref:hypothetical protein n=1 Tax=Microbacterium sp. NPDC057407 TaxID=3346120 RepID=UPI00366D1419